MHRAHTETDVVIGVCPAPRRREALCLLFGRLPISERDAVTHSLLEAQARGKIDLGGLLIAWGPRGLQGVVWAQVQPGRTAVLWSPRLLPGAAQEVANDLVAEAVALLSSRQVVMAQALLRIAGDRHAAALERVGFFHLTDLLYLRAPTEMAQPAQEGELSFQAYRQARRERFAEVISQTYDQTKDCPALNGLRDLDDVIRGYQATGIHDPSRWLLGCSGKQSVGVLLLTDHPSMESWELIYMGIVPAHRGQGYGAQLVQQALRMAKAAGREYLVLGVDAQNAPALEVYQRAGFSTWDRRAIYLKRFDA